MSELGRLRWRCRRGMRELDQLLLRYLEDRYPNAPQSERDRFVVLLELSDPQLWAYLSGREQPSDSADQDIVRRISLAT